MAIVAAHVAELYGLDVSGAMINTVTDKLIPELEAWQAALARTGIGEKSVSADFEEAFSNFCLAERTFLGRGANFNEAPVGKKVANGGGCCC